MKVSKRIESKLNKAIKEVTENIVEFKHNLAVIKIRNLFSLILEEGIDKKGAESFLKLLHVYCPFMSEELWEKIGGKGYISLAKWPIVDEKKIDKKLEEAEKAVEGVVEDIMNIIGMLKEKGKDVEKVYLYVLPGEFENYDASVLSKKVDLKVNVYKVNDKAKHDPEGKSKKARPGKPAIYME